MRVAVSIALHDESVSQSVPYVGTELLWQLKRGVKNGWEKVPLSATSCNFHRHPQPARLYANKVGSDLIVICGAL